MGNPKEIFDCCKKEYDITFLKKCLIDSQNRFFRYCTRCVSGSAAVPDVFIGKTSGDVMTEENIADPATGQPIPFWDKKSKLAAMRKADVREAGDRVHGARVESFKHRSYSI